MDEYNPKGPNLSFDLVTRFHLGCTINNSRFLLSTRTSMMKSVQLQQKRGELGRFGLSGDIYDDIQLTTATASSESAEKARRILNKPWQCFCFPNDILLNA